MALLGAALVLWPAGANGPWYDQLPVPASTADWLGLTGGMAFALNNVLLRRGVQQSQESQALAMFCGGIVVAGSVAAGLGLARLIPWPPDFAWPWVFITVCLGLWFLLGNFSLQYGASRLPANVTSVVMLSEIVFATGSSALLGASQIGTLMWAGGMLIVLAAWLSC
jgi:drug/metabolite transporter (DMT)-like permease